MPEAPAARLDCEVTSRMKLVLRQVDVVIVNLSTQLWPDSSGTPFTRQEKKKRHVYVFKAPFLYSVTMQSNEILTDVLTHVFSFG